MPQRIEAPTPEDVNRIAHQLVHAEEVIVQATGASLSGGKSDLTLLQQALDSKLLEPEAPKIVLTTENFPSYVPR
jgi:hypothetical protein